MKANLNCSEEVPDTENKPGRWTGRAGAAVCLLVAVGVSFTNAWHHPRASLLRDVQRLKQGDSTEAVLERAQRLEANVKGSGFFGVKTSSGFSGSMDGVLNIQCRSPGKWQFCSFEFPFVEPLNQWLWEKHGHSGWGHRDSVYVRVYFKDDKAMSYEIPERSSAIVSLFP